MSPSNMVLAFPECHQLWGTGQANCGFPTLCCLTNPMCWMGIKTTYSPGTEANIHRCFSVGLLTYHVPETPLHNPQHWLVDHPKRKISTLINGLPLCFPTISPTPLVFCVPPGQSQFEHELVVGTPSTCGKHCCLLHHNSMRWTPTVASKSQMK